MDDVRQALRAARPPHGSFPRLRLRVTPAVHEQLAYDLCEDEPDLHPLGIHITSLGGVPVLLDADVPDPGWIIDTMAAIR
jgi:hypothetical protein